MTATEYVILVDTNDCEIGQAEKLEAHRKSLLHRAFSIFIFHGQHLLLQQRALGKYHSAGLWTNTCCSHPRPGEAILDAGQRRLMEELGFTTPLSNRGSFQYTAQFNNGLTEHELDHVLVGQLDHTALVKPNPTEIKAIRWVTVTALREELKAHPEQFTPWLLEALDLAAEKTL